MSNLPPNLPPKLAYKLEQYAKPTTCPMIKRHWSLDDIHLLLTLTPIYGKEFQNYYPHFNGKYTTYDIKMMYKVLTQK